MADQALARADESVATRFTRIMNATTSPWGVLTDPPILAIFTSAFSVALLIALRLDVDPTIVRLIGAAAAAPIVIGVVATLALFGARGRVVAWLASLPFPLENMNAVLNGLGDSLEIAFAGERPTHAELNAALDQVSPDCFVTRGEGIEAAGGKPAGDPRVIEIRIGIIDSKRNPSGSNHRRYQRVQEIATRVLAPMHARFPIAEVRVK